MKWTIVDQWKRTFEGLGWDTGGVVGGWWIGVRRGVGGGMISTWENSVGFSFACFP